MPFTHGNGCGRWLASPHTLYWMVIEGKDKNVKLIHPCCTSSGNCIPDHINQFKYLPLPGQSQLATR